MKMLLDEYKGEIMETRRYANMGTNQTLKVLTFIKYMLRIGVACTFIGHGLNAMTIKQNWIPLLTVYGFSVEQAKILMPWIGVLDILVALLVVIHPFRTVVIWAIFWTFATALTRVIAGEAVWEFIERAANWSTPLALLLLTNLETANQQTKWIAISKKTREKTSLTLLMKKFPFFFALFF